MAGKYNNPAYGDIELCYVAPANNNSTKVQASDSCKALIASAPTVLPGIIDGASNRGGVPTFLIHWDSLWASHAVFRHYDGNFFNMTMWDSTVSIS
jgi:hypothetical protein